MRAQPYLYFEGRCEEAIEFYKTAVGATEVMAMRFSDNPNPTPPGMIPEGADHKIMHACLQIGETQVMVSDGRCQGLAAGAFSGFSIALTIKGEAETQAAFERLAEGGAVQVPLAATFFSPCFGMLTDRFGVSWTVLAE